MVSHEIETYDVLCRTDPPMFDFTSTKGPELDHAKVKFIAPVPTSVTEDKPYAINEGFRELLLQVCSSAHDFATYGWY